MRKSFGRLVPMSLAATLALAACTGKPVTPAVPGAAEQRASAARTAAPLTTATLTAEVRGPRAGIVQNHVAGVMANHGAGLVPTGGSTLIASNTSRVIGNQGAMYQQLALDELVEPIAGARVEAVDPAGRPVAAAVTTDAAGRCKLTVATRGAVVLLRVRYEVDGQAITLGGLAGVDAKAPVAVDPATTLVAKRVDDLRRRGGIAADGLSASAFDRAAAAIAPRLGAEAVVAAAVLPAKEASQAFETLRTQDKELNAALAAATGNQAGLGAAEAPTPIASAEATSGFALPGEPDAATPAPEQSFAPPPPQEPEPTRTPDRPRGTERPSTPPSATPSPSPRPSDTPRPSTSPSTPPSPEQTPPQNGTNGFAATLASANTLALQGKGTQADEKYDDAVDLATTLAQCLEVAAAARQYGRTMAADEAMDDALDKARTSAESQSVGIKASQWGRGAIADDAFDQAKDQCQSFDEALALTDVVNLHRRAQLDEIYDRVFELATTIDMCFAGATKAQVHGQAGEVEDGLEKAVQLVRSAEDGIRVGDKAVGLFQMSVADDGYKRGADKATTAAQARAVEAAAKAKFRNNAANYAAQKAVALGG